MSEAAHQTTPAEKFREAMKKILSVPKAEILRREDEYKKQRKQKSSLR